VYLIGKLDLATLLPFIAPEAAAQFAKEGKAFYDEEKEEVGGIRTWFALSREGGDFGGQVLLHIKFTPLLGSKLMATAPKEADYPLYSLATADGVSGARRGSTLTPEGGRRNRESVSFKDKARGKVFGVPLSSASAMSDTRFPTPVWECVRYIRACDLKEVGIFRVSGAKNKINEAIKRYNKGEVVALQGIHHATGILKQYFRELPGPAISFHAYESFIKIAKASKGYQFLQSIRQRQWAETLTQYKAHRL